MRLLARYGRYSMSRIAQRAGKSKKDSLTEGKPFKNYKFQRRMQGDSCHFFIFLLT
jgi:hypothetical protein